MADKEVQELRKLVAELTRRVDVLQYQLKEEREAREVVAARVGVLELGLNALSRGPIMPVLAAAAAVAPSSPVEQQAPADKTEGKISKAADRYHFWINILATSNTARAARSCLTLAS
jgi:hypothetical protein